MSDVLQIVFVWAPLFGLCLWGLLRLTEWRDLRPETHRDRVLRARRDIR